MKDFAFETTPEGQRFCLEIISKMMEFHGISEEEAIGRLNRHWCGQQISNENHETAEDWAMIIYYGHDSLWWKGTAGLQPKPYP
jgi:hypothetical protein